MFNQYPDVLTVPQVAEALRIGRAAAYKLVNKKVIGSVRIGKTIRVPKSNLIAYVESSRYNVNL